MPDQVKYTQRLQGAKVLVIGGSSGIGFGVAEACVEHGCTVIISSSNPDKIQKVVTKLQTSYPSRTAHISGHACDLSDQAHLERNVRALLEKVGRNIDHIVFTAGDSLGVLPLSDISMDRVQRAGTIRFFAPLFVAKFAQEFMAPGPRSSLVLTTGSVSERPRPDWSVVGSFATGLQGMTRGLALDLKPIRVNCVAPGLVVTELWDGMSEDLRTKMYEESARKLPVGKIGSVEDLAECYLYLMKDHNTTGTMVSSNGGAMLV